MGLVALLACAGIAQGYPVGPAVSLEKMTEEADIIFKGTVVSSETVEDEWFKPYRGFHVQESQFNVMSVIKGELPGKTLMIRHYEENPQPLGYEMAPQHYRFDAAKTYIVFAKTTEVPGVFRQLWKNHTIKGDQGVLRCGNDKPVTPGTVKDVLWSEVTTMLASAEGDDVVYAIKQLDQMSGGRGGFGALSDFDRKDVLAAVRGLTTHDDSKVAQAAIGVVGSHNPYMSEERTLHWLATVGSGTMPGMGKMDAKMKNLGGELYWKDLVALVDGTAPPETRAMAVRALGLVREPLLKEPVERWLGDPSPEVRASATVLLADFPGPETSARLTTLAGDPAPEVRMFTARAIGFGQMVELADVLANLLRDNEFNVRQEAARGLLSFSPKNEAISRILRANIHNDEFAPFFLLALARENPADYLDGLAIVVVDKPERRISWSAQIPAFTAWEILFKYLQAQPAEDIRAGKFDRYLDAIERVGNYSSSEPRDIYAFYLQRGMTERAKKYREEAKKAVKYDLDYYFNMVDENPSRYKRE